MNPLRVNSLPGAGRVHDLVGRVEELGAGQGGRPPLPRGDGHEGEAGLVEPGVHAGANVKRRPVRVRYSILSGLLPSHRALQYKTILYYKSSVHILAYIDSKTILVLF